MNDKIFKALIDASKDLPPMTPEQRRLQVISFAFGNVNIENPNITKEMIEKAYDKLHASEKAR